MRLKLAAGSLAAGRRIALYLCLGILCALPFPAGAQELTRNQVFELQFRLNQLGHNAGRPDGRAGGRTRSALYAFAEAHATSPDMTPAFLARVRAAARSVEGIANENGSIDFLVFTDAGTPLIFTVEAIGRIGADVSAAGGGVGDVAANAAAAIEPSIEATFDLPRAVGVAFGARVRLPAPPEGERLQIDHVVSEPERLADGTVRFTEHVSEHVILDGDASSRLWFWRFETMPDASRASAWRFSIENAGEILLTRVFRVGG